MVEVSNLTEKTKLSEIVHHSKEVYLKIGVSNLLLMIDCPFQFHLRRIKGIDVPVGQQFGAGNVLHKVIERLLLEPGIDFRQVIEQEVYLPLAERYFEERAKRVITKRIESLVQSGYLEGIKFGEIQFKILIKNMVLVGIIDAIREDKQGLEVIDWKSSIHDSLRNRYENQIRIYSQALRLKGKTVKKGLVYNLHQIDCAPVNCILEVDIAEPKVQELIRKAETNLDTLMNGIPTATPSNISCGSCDVAAVCKYSIKPNIETVVEKK